MGYVGFAVLGWSFDSLWDSQLEREGKEGGGGIPGFLIVFFFFFKYGVFWKCVLLLFNIQSNMSLV